MSDLAPAAAVLHSIASLLASGGPLADLDRAIREDALLGRRVRFSDSTSWTDVFTGLDPARGAGVSAALSARRPDGRRVTWFVEAWIDTWQGGTFSALIKGHVDEDDGTSGCEETCLFDIQRSASDVAELVDAVRVCAMAVVEQR